MKDPTGAVEYRVRGQANGTELTVARGGPFPVE
jgi:hypothetical protein